MSRLDVQTSGMQPRMALVAGFIMVPLGLLSLASGLMGGISVVPLGIGVAMLGMFGFVLWLSRKGRSKSVQYFSNEGLQRGDGRWLPWSELERVVYQIRVRPGDDTKGLWRTEIWFRNGESAWLLPLQVRNAREVNGLVASLPCEHV